MGPFHGSGTAQGRHFRGQVGYSRYSEYHAVRVQPEQALGIAVRTPVRSIVQASSQSTPSLTNLFALAPYNNPSAYIDPLEEGSEEDCFFHTPYGDVVNAFLVMHGLRSGCIFDLLDYDETAKLERAITKSTHGHIQPLSGGRGLYNTHEVSPEFIAAYESTGCPVSTAHILGYPLLDCGGPTMETLRRPPERSNSFIAGVFVDIKDRSSPWTDWDNIMTACYGPTADHAEALRNFEVQAARFRGALVGQCCGPYIITGVRAELEKKDGSKFSQP